jgi:hypothetical protein
MDFDDVFTEHDFDMLFGDDCDLDTMDGDNNYCVCGDTEVRTEETITSITPPLTEEDQNYIRQVNDVVSMYKDLMGFVNNSAKGLIETRFCYIRSNKYVKCLLLTEIRNIMDDNHFIKQRYIDRYYEIKRIYFIYGRGGD